MLVQVCFFFWGGGVLSLRDFLRFPVLPHSIIPVT